MPIVSLISAPRSCPCDRASVCPPTLETDQSLGRATHQGDIIEVQEPRKGGRIDPTQAAIQVGRSHETVTASIIVAANRHPKPMYRTGSVDTTGPQISLTSP